MACEDTITHAQSMRQIDAERTRNIHEIVIAFAICSCYNGADWRY